MKQLALLTVLVLLLCLSILLLRPSSPPLLLSLQTSNSDRRLSVFLSDLPRALNYGLLDLYWSLPAADSRIPASSDPDHPAPRTRPPYPNNPLIKQYSAEYWLLASLRPDSASANSSVKWKNNIVVVGGNTRASSSNKVSASQAVDVNWWGHKYGFVSGGFLGAKSRKNKSSAPKGSSNVRQTFAEEDQENLYNLV